MKIFIFGSRGMAGHMIKEYFMKETDYDIVISSREESSDKNHYKIDILNDEKVLAALDDAKPDIIINCTGILNDEAERNQELALKVNGVFPHRLAKWANENHKKVIQISTDCVFKGDRGNYAETDKPDGATSYAISKRVGELMSDRHITIRTSIIGPEIKRNGIGLFQWFMNQKGKIHGYQKVKWNGITTLQLAKVIDAMIKNDCSGLYHITAPHPITKHHLLKMLQSIFQKNDVIITPVNAPVLDRTLKATRKDFHCQIPNYETMLFELKEWMNRCDR